MSSHQTRGESSAVHFASYSKSESKHDDGAKEISVKPESGVKECDSSVAIELFGPIWDDINLKDGVVECRESGRTFN